MLKNNKKNAYSLIENLTALMLMVIISSIITMILTYIVKFNNQYNQYNKSIYTTEEFLRFVHVRIKGDITVSHEISSNTLILTQTSYENPTICKKAVIKKESNNVIIEYFNAYGTKETSKILLKNVIDIQFVQKGNILYVHINKQGEKETIKGISV